MGTIISMYSQMPSIKKIGGRSKVLVIEEGTAVPLHTDPQFVSIQQRPSVPDKDTKSKKKGEKVR